MVRCYWCPSCNQWGRRFQYGCRKCKLGEFKHSKCGNWVTAQYGFCPRCYPDRLLPKPEKVRITRKKVKQSGVVQKKITAQQIQQQLQEQLQKQIQEQYGDEKVEVNVHFIDTPDGKEDPLQHIQQQIEEQLQDQLQKPIKVQVGANSPESIAVQIITNDTNGKLPGLANKDKDKDKPTMPKGWVITQVVRDVEVPSEERPTMPKGWYDGKQEVRQETSYIIKKDSENFTNSY